MITAETHAAYLLAVSMVGLAFAGCEMAPPTDDLSSWQSASSLAQCPAPASPNGFGYWMNCDPTTGLPGPVPACSAGSPCSGNTYITYDTDGTLELFAPLGSTTSFILPTCQATNPQQPAPLLPGDGPPWQWTDPVTGDPEAACVYVPSGATANTPAPLVVFFAGSHSTAKSVYDSTLLRYKAPSFALPGAASAGFILAALEPRAMKGTSDPSSGALSWDWGFRDLSSPSCNEDVRAADQLIDQLVANGSVDRQRIYVTGWSAGANFAQMYAVARHATATPGGSRVAAVTVYAGSDPFDMFKPDQRSCQLDPYPSSDVPILVVHRNCDGLVPCDANQATAWNRPPESGVEYWLRKTLPVAVSDSNGSDMLLNSDGQGNGLSLFGCQPPGTGLGQCSLLLGTVAHTDWPDGIDNESTDLEPQMLNFLAQHSLAN